MYSFVLMSLVVFHSEMKMEVSSGFYASLLLHNIGNEKKSFYVFTDFIWVRSETEYSMKESMH